MQNDLVALCLFLEILFAAKGEFPRVLIMLRLREEVESGFIECEL